MGSGVRLAYKPDFSSYYLCDLRQVDLIITIEVCCHPTAQSQDIKRISQNGGQLPIFGDSYGHKWQGRRNLTSTARYYEVLSKKMKIAGNRLWFLQSCPLESRDIKRKTDLESEQLAQNVVSDNGIWTSGPSLKKWQIPSERKNRADKGCG